MKKNNLIRFLESFVLLPVITVSMPLGSLYGSFLIYGIDSVPSQIVLLQKENIEAGDLLAFNQAVDPKVDLRVQTLQAQANTIDAYFKVRNMPLEGLGMKMALEAEKNDIDWRLLPAIAIRESSGGKNACNKMKNNFFGWGSCKIGFNSDEEAIETVALNLGGNNLKTAGYYDNKTIKQILRAYNPPSIVPHYAEQVMSIMKSIGEADTAVVL